MRNESTQSAQRLVTSRQAGLVALLFLCVVGPWVKDLSAQPASRLAFTAAVAEEGTLRVDEYQSILGVDRVELDGHLYSDKAPGQPLMAVPFYAAERAIGADQAGVPRERGNLTLWWVTLWSSVIPGAVLVALTIRTTSRFEGGAMAAVGMTFGTLLLPFSSELYGHVFATCLTVGAWILLSEPGQRWRLATAGFLLGVAVLVEYQMVLAVAILVSYTVVRRGWTGALRLVAGAVPAAIALLVYQAIAFGSPFSSSYSEKPVHAEGGIAVVGMPDPRQALEVLFGTRGLLLFTPIVAIALYGTVRLVKAAHRRDRDAAVIGLAMFGAYWGLQAGWLNPWGGEMPGPRYLIPALPFLAAGLALVLRKTGVLGRGALVFSMAVMSLPLITNHLVPAGGATGSQQIHYLREGMLSPTIWTMSIGWAGWVLHAATVGVLIVLLIRSVRGARDPDAARSAWAW